VPVGSFEGFLWQNGKWVHVPVVEELNPNRPIPRVEQQGNKKAIQGKKNIPHP
jgi:hypothetical protein